MALIADRCLSVSDNHWNRKQRSLHSPAEGVRNSMDGRDRGMDNIFMERHVANRARSETLRAYAHSIIADTICVSGFAA